MKCNKCGHEIESDAYFCPKCGNGLLEEDYDDIYDGGEVRKKIIRLGVVVGIAFFVLIPLLCWGNSIRERNARKTQRKAENVTEDIKENYEETEKINIAEEVETAYSELYSGSRSYEFSEKQKQAFEQRESYKVIDLDKDGVSECIVNCGGAIFIFSYHVDEKEINCVFSESLQYDFETMWGFDGERKTEIGINEENEIEVEVSGNDGNTEQKSVHIYTYLEYEQEEVYILQTFSEYKQISFPIVTIYTVEGEEVSKEEYQEVESEYSDKKMIETLDEVYWEYDGSGQ